MNKNNTAAKAAKQIELQAPARLQVKGLQVADEQRVAIIAKARELAVVAGRKTVNVTDVIAAHAEVTKPVPAAALKKLADEVKAHVEKKAKKADGESKLDWAYRRLRRTTFDFIVRKVKLNDDDRKALREELERVRHDYGSLRVAVESMNAAWNIDFEDILEEFFGHVIHPGSGNHGVRKD